MEKRKKSPGECKAMIAFVACSKTKSSRVCKARELYQGPLFKKAFYHAKKNYEYVYILSAKYGVLHPDDIISPYHNEKTLRTMTKNEREEWYQWVSNQMIKMELRPPYIFFTGELYYKNFFTGEKPLQNLTIGRQLRWFNQQSSKKRLL